MIAAAHCGGLRIAAAPALSGSRLCFFFFFSPSLSLPACSLPPVLTSLPPVLFAAVLAERWRHWRAGPGRLDETAPDEREGGCRCVWAGTADQASTNFMAIKASIFQFFDERLH